MTNDLAKTADYAPTTTKTIGAVSEVRSKQIYALASAIDSLPESEPLAVDHKFHAGVYMRTSLLPAGQVSCGAQLKIPTALIVAGHCRIVAGGGPIEVNGYQVMKGAPGRQVVVYAIEDTWLTCLWATEAKTQQEAELEAVGGEQISFLKEK